MKARAIFDSKNKVWNVLGEYKGEWLKLGKNKGSSVEFLEFETKELAEEFIINKYGLKLSK